MSQGDLRIPIAVVFCPVWVSLALMLNLECIVPYLTPQAQADEAGHRMAFDHALFCVVLYILPLLAIFAHLIHAFQCPFLLVMAPHMLVMLVSFVYCLYTWCQNYYG